MQDLARIFIAGHTGMVGSAICHALESRGVKEIITRSSTSLDLRDSSATEDFVKEAQPDALIIAAARVGGIKANNDYPAQFIYDNLLISSSLINAAYRCRVKRLIFLGSSCVYPRNAPQPIQEEALLDGHLERTNEPYAIAKIAGIKMCESYRRQYGCDFRSLMPTNLYGPGDNFHPEHSHVLPGLLRRIHEAKVNDAKFVNVWGTGKPRREFLHVDDLASACCHFLMMDEREYWAGLPSQCSHINIGTGEDLSIREIAENIAEIVGYRGKVTYDPSKPDGTPRKLLDVSLAERKGWRSSITVKEGIKNTYDWYLKNLNQVREVGMLSGSERA